jgi:hypothetical protein
MAIVLIQTCLENTGILHAGQMTDHANRADTDFFLLVNFLILKKINFD